MVVHADGTGHVEDVAVEAHWHIEQEARADLLGDERLVGEIDIGGRRGSRQQREDNRYEKVAKCPHGVLRLTQG